MQNILCEEEKYAYNLHRFPDCRKGCLQKEVLKFKEIFFIKDSLDYGISDYEKKCFSQCSFKTFALI